MCFFGAMDIPTQVVNRKNPRFGGNSQGNYVPLKPNVESAVKAALAHLIELCTVRGPTS
jgi:hypothetical protein